MTLIRGELRPDIDGPLYVDCDGDCHPSECRGRHPVNCFCGLPAVTMVDNDIGMCRSCKEWYDSEEIELKIKGE